jgi:hypothetical protein
MVLVVGGHLQVFYLAGGRLGVSRAGDDPNLGEHRFEHLKKLGFVLGREQLVADPLPRCVDRPSVKTSASAPKSS